MRPPRAALTLIDAVTAALLALVVLALLAPAVHKLRGYAARAGCATHLREIGVGFHRHHDAHGVLPQGGDSGPDGGAARPEARAEWSWAYHLLPHLGREGLHRADARTVDRTPVPPFYCPQRRPPAGPTAALDYAGNAGSDGLDGAVVRGAAPKLSLKDVGGRTLLAAERRMNGAWLGTGASDRRPYNRAGWTDAAQAYRVGAEPPGRDWYDPGRDDVTLRFGSSHPAGLNALFGDGSVRHVRYDVDGAVWRRACVRDGPRSED